jgi:hypothetical protein
MHILSLTIINQNCQYPCISGNYRGHGREPIKLKATKSMYQQFLYVQNPKPHEETSSLEFPEDYSVVLRVLAVHFLIR